jgi:hypothetical protein
VNWGCPKILHILGDSSELFSTQQQKGDSKAVVNKSKGSRLVQKKREKRMLRKIRNSTWEMRKPSLIRKSARRDLLSSRLETPFKALMILKNKWFPGSGTDQISRKPGKRP